MEGRTVPVVTGLVLSLTVWIALLVATRPRADAAARVASGPRPLRRYAARTALLALVAAIAVVTSPSLSGIAALARNGGIDSAKVLKALPFGLNKLESVFPVGPLVSAADFYIGERNRRDWQAEKAKLSFHAKLTPAGGATGSAKTVYVLVIGESSRGDRWQLGGYARPTNPLLASEANVVFLRDVVTPWTFTLGSVPVIASRKSGTDRSRFFAEKSVVSLFKEAGFRTTWISNQPRPTGIGSEIADISSEADKKVWLNAAERDYARKTTYDDAVVAALHTTLAAEEPRQFIVIHLMGSHDAYQSRYPAAYNKFHPSLTDEPTLNDHDRANRAAVGNSYDNSILYTDAVLHAVIAALKDTKATAGLLYTSDHGESLFDGDCDFVGHGGTARENYMVSALAWLSDEAVAARPEAFAALQRNAGRRLSTENIFDSLAGMAGISYAEARPARSILSERFAETDRMVNVGGASVDWDRADFAGACHKPVPRQQGVAAR